MILVKGVTDSETGAVYVIGYEGPVALVGAAFKEGLEGGADGRFVGGLKVSELIEGILVGSIEAAGRI